jgi:predicted HTH domain antitoxin
MKMQSLTIDIPSDIFVAVNETKQEIKDWIKVMLATHLYQLKKLTIGKAAQLAGMQKIEFETFLSKNKIPISNLEWEDVEADIEKLR